MNPIDVVMREMNQACRIVDIPDNWAVGGDLTESVADALQVTKSGRGVYIDQHGRVWEVCTHTFLRRVRT